MQPSEAFREAARPLWDAQVAHPFVRGIALGTLAEERFRRWLVQDHAYLREYARVLAFAAARADRLESTRWYARLLHLTLETEMDLHRRFCARFGVTPADLAAAPLWPTTRAYADFLVRTAATGDGADVVAALLPCTWGYVHLAAGIASASPADERYREWIRQYNDPAFAEAAVWLRAELDRLAAGAPPETLARLRELFLTSSRYELRFWDMCWEGEG